MHHIVTATAATVFLSDTFLGVDCHRMAMDYHEIYHGKRPPDPVITDHFIFIDATGTGENVRACTSVHDLVKKHDLRSVNFILLNRPEFAMGIEELSLLKLRMKNWDGYFKKNSYNGSLNLSICTQNFEATLLEGYKIRGVNRLALGII